MAIANKALAAMALMAALSGCSDPNDAWANDEAFCQHYHSCDWYCMFHVCSD